MKSVNLSGLLSRATLYEQWRAPLSPKLRATAIASGPAILLGLVPLVAALTNYFPSLAAPLPAGDLSLFLLNLLQAVLWMIVALDAAALLIYIPMLVVTRTLREGQARWHKIAYAEALLGAVHGFVLALGLAGTIIVVVGGVILTVIALFIVLAGAGSSSR